MDSETKERVLALIVELYRDEPVGGMLHVQLDDGNLEDVFFDDPFDDWLKRLHDREPLAVEEEIVELMRGMTYEEREEAYESFWGRFPMERV